eukprot:1292810-Rhodomonas_salina.2
MSAQVTFPFSKDRVFLAHCYPYTYTDLQQYIVKLEADAETQIPKPKTQNPTSTQTQNPKFLPKPYRLPGTTDLKGYLETNPAQGQGNPENLPASPAVSAPIRLRACYAISGTEIVYDATRCRTVAGNRCDLLTITAGNTVEVFTPSPTSALQTHQALTCSRFPTSFHPTAAHSRRKQLPHLPSSCSPLRAHPHHTPLAGGSDAGGGGAATQAGAVPAYARGTTCVVLTQRMAVPVRGILTKVAPVCDMGCPVLT